jgi:3-methyladenine DNA glycosylase AlkD
MAGKDLKQDAIVDPVKSEHRTNAIRERKGLYRHTISAYSCGCPDPGCGAFHLIHIERTIPTAAEADANLAADSGYARCPHGPIWLAGNPRSGRKPVHRPRPMRPVVLTRKRISTSVTPLRETVAKKPTTRTPAKHRAGSTEPVPAPAKATAVALGQVVKHLDTLGNEAVRKQNARWAAGGIQPGATQFGVKHGEIRTLAKKIGPDPALAASLWQTRNVDAQLLAVLLLKPTDLSGKEVDRMVRTISFGWVADWLINYVVKRHADKEALRRQWMADDDRWAARAGWSLTAERVAKCPDGLDLQALLDRIESEMGTADPAAQWTMNAALAEIGMHFPEHRERAVAIGEALGVYRDYPVSKGCTSPFAPIWIDAMVSRKG